MRSDYTPGLLLRLAHASRQIWTQESDKLRSSFMFFRWFTQDKRRSFGAVLLRLNKAPNGKTYTTIVSNMAR